MPLQMEVKTNLGPSSHREWGKGGEASGLASSHMVPWFWIGEGVLITDKQIDEEL